jgi:transcriptional regulator with XRE-family HTH domain
MARRRYNARKVSKALGLRIRELRHERGWTLEECEEHGWTNWKHLQAIESGKNFTIHTLVNLANLFGVSLATLLQNL